jgi:hypothetical protein
VWEGSQEEKKVVDIPCARDEGQKGTGQEALAERNSEAVGKVGTLQGLY